MNNIQKISVLLELLGQLGEQAEILEAQYSRYGGDRKMRIHIDSKSFKLLFTEFSAEPHDEKFDRLVAKIGEVYVFALEGKS